MSNRKTVSFFSMQAATSERAPMIADISFGEKNKKMCDDLDIALHEGKLDKLVDLASDALNWTQFVDVKGGQEWSDVLIPTNSVHPLLVSKQVVEDWIQAGITGYTLIPQKIRKVQSPSLKFIHKPEIYFGIHPRGKLQFNYNFYEKVGNSYVFRFSCLDPATESRARFMAEGYIQHVQLVPLEESWDGSDLILTPGHGLVGPFGRCFCSRRLVELAHEKLWSNFTFSPVDVLDNSSVDFRERPWPPEKWYPENHPLLQ